MPDQTTTTDYDLEPVSYCSRCYSLKIKYEDAIDAECCMDCGSSDISETTIDEWEKLYERRYGHKFTVKGGDPKKSAFFKLSMKELKNKVFESPRWREIIRTLYPRFPGGLGRADSIVLLFDKLSKDSKIDDLRLLLMNQIKSKSNGREEVKDFRQGSKR